MRTHKERTTQATHPHTRATYHCHGGRTGSLPLGHVAVGRRHEKRECHPVLELHRDSALPVALWPVDPAAGAKSGSKVGSSSFQAERHQNIGVARCRTLKVSRSLRRQWPTTTPTRLGDLVVRSGAGITKARSPRPMSVSSFVSGSCRDSRRACNNPTNTTAYQNQLRSAILLLKIVSWLKDLPRHERHAEPRPRRGPQRGCGPAPQTRRRADCTETPGHGRLSPPGPVWWQGTKVHSNLFRLCY